MRSIVGFSLKNRFFVLVLATALLIIGTVQLRHMPVDILPEFAPPSVEIQTEALGLAPEEVEQLITVPMETDLLLGVPWLKTMRSQSLPGMSSIVLIFQPGTDLMRARQMVSERLTQAVALPHVSKPPTMLQPMSSSSRVMLVGLSSKDLSLIQMSVLARWTIAPRLMGIPGVANVNIWGQRDRQLQVLVDPKRLQQSKVPLLNVLETTANALWVSSLSFVEASTPGTGGFIDTSNQRLGIRHILPIVSPEGLAQVPIQETDLKLSDVATVVEDHQPLIGDALANGSNSLLLVVEKLPGANTAEVTNAVEAALNGMRPGLPGMQVDTSLFRPVDFIDSAVNNVTLALGLGLLLLLAILLAFFFSWRPAVISLIAVPLSWLAAVGVLYLRGETMNVVALAGLAMAIGVLVDDAIVDVENVRRRLRQNDAESGTRSKASIIMEAAGEMRSSMGFALVILLIAVVPVFFIGGAAGDFLAPLAVSYVLAVIASMVVALLVTPALCLGLLARKPAGSAGAGSSRGQWLERGYRAALAGIVSHSRLLIVAVVGVTLIGVLMVPATRLSLLPELKQRDLLVHLNAAPGTSQPEMSRISGRVSQELRAIPGVRGVAAQVGRAVQGDQVVNVSSAELWVSIDPAANYETTSHALKAALAGYPGVHSDVQSYLTDQSKAVEPSASHPIDVRIYGDSTETLRSQAQAIQKALGSVQGVVDPRINLPVVQPEIQIEPDLAATQRVGLKPGDVRRAAATLLSGTQVGNLFEQQKVFDVVVWGSPEARRNIQSIKDLVIDSPNGQLVRIGDVAQVRVAPSESIIRHDAAKRYVDVVAGVKGRSLGAVQADVSNSIKKMQFPMEYHAELLSDFTDQQAAQTRLLVLALAALIGAYFLLQAAFGSWSLALVVILTLPAALAGGAVAVRLTGGVWSLGSLAGLMVVFGIAVRSGIALIRHYQYLQHDEGEAFGPELILRGATDRSTPILMAAMATAFALLPALILGDVPGLEFVRPMAVVVVGGLVTSTLLELFVMPSFCLALQVSPQADLEFAPASEHEAEGTPGPVGSQPEAGMAGGE